MSAVLLIIINIVDEVTGRCLDMSCSQKAAVFNMKKPFLLSLITRLIHYILRHKVIRCLTLIKLMQT